MPYAFIRSSQPMGEVKDVYLRDEKFFEDALFNFVFQELGYYPIEIKGKDIEVKEI